MRLSKFDQSVYAAAIAGLVTAKADDILRDGPGTAHLIGDAAMHQVREARVRVRAARMRLRSQPRARR